MWTEKEEGRKKCVGERQSSRSTPHPGNLDPEPICFRLYFANSQRRDSVCKVFGVLLITRRVGEDLAADVINKPNVFVLAPLLSVDRLTVAPRKKQKLSIVGSEISDGWLAKFIYL